MSKSSAARLADSFSAPGRLQTLTARELALWLACVLFVNQLLFVPSDSAKLAGVVAVLTAKSIFFYVAWWAVIGLLLKGDRSRLPTGTEFSAVAAAGLVTLSPIAGAGWLATTLIGGLLLLYRRHDPLMQAVAAVLLALAFNGYWGPKLFNVFGYYILRADAALVGSVLAATKSGMSWSETVVGQVGGHSILIFSPCSSFHNVSLGLLCWVSVTKLLRTPWQRGDAAIGVLIGGTLILFNATRLYLMALSSENYAYWHGGVGEQLMAWASTMTVLALSVWGAVRPVR